MGSYINNQGISAGPVRITDITNKNYLGLWLVTASEGIHIKDQWYLTNDDDDNLALSNYKTLYADSDVDNDWSLTNVKTVKQLMAEWDPVNPDIDLDDYATKEDMTIIKKVIFGPEGSGTYEGNGLISEVNVLQSSVSTLIGDMTNLKPRVVQLATKVEALESNFIKYIINPFPEGVIFIGGGA